ncbi:hypothetical protein M885DRAFT_571708 [Pelagophyceae sp. CCMP2097]|nr:hypothetical protein M885DRAFT_571708 [Pelagophyceae sp. CCMP2097]
MAYATRVVEEQGVDEQAPHIEAMRHLSTVLAAALESGDVDRIVDGLVVPVYARQCAATAEGPQCDVAACAAPGGDAFAGDRIRLLHHTLPLKTRPRSAPACLRKWIRGRTRADARLRVFVCRRVRFSVSRMSVTAAARGLRAAATDPETEVYRTLTGFLAARDEVNRAAFDFAPTNGAAAFDDVGGGKILRQDLCGTAAGVDAQLEALYARADAAKDKLDDFCRRLVIAAGLDPDEEMIREAGHDGRVDKVLRAYSAGLLKTPKRATEKAKNEYDGDAARLVDIVRGSIVCGDEASLVAVLQRLFGYSDGGVVCVVRSKNRFRKPLFNGYRDVLVNLLLRLPDGTSMVVELQVHLVQTFEFKAKTRVFYEFFRNYFCGNLDVVAEGVKVLEAIAGGDVLESAGRVQAKTGA